MKALGPAFVLQVTGIIVIVVIIVVVVISVTILYEFDQIHGSVSPKKSEGVTKEKGVTVQKLIPYEK